MDNLDFDNLSQAEIARLIGVDRTTIRAWGQLGMPHKEPTTKGGKGSYCSALCLHWRAGHKLSEDRALMNIELSPLQKVAIGWLAGNAAHISAADEKQFLSMMVIADVGREQALRYLEYARGILRRR